FNGATDFVAQSGVNHDGTNGVAEKLNFGNFEKFDISGYKWVDTDGDKTWDTGELGKQGWVIYLDNDNNLGNGVIASTVTDANGKYSFTDLGPGHYYVYEASQANWINTFNGATDFVAQSGVDHVGHFETTEALNFGNHHFEPGNNGRTKGFW